MPISYQPPIVGLDNQYLQLQYALDNTSKLTRNSATEFQIETQTGRRNFLVVNGEIVSLSSAKTCTVSGEGVHNLLAADGTDASATPSASTLYYVYLSNASASFAASSCRLSATAPSADANGILYLATSGNGHNWRFVGAVYVNASVEIGDNFAICGYGASVDILSLGSQIDRTSGTPGHYDILSLSCVNLNGTKINIYANACLSYNNNSAAGPIVFYLYIDDVEKDSAYSFYCNQSNLNVSRQITSNSIGTLSVKTKYLWPNGLKVSVLVYHTGITISRETL